MKAFSRPVVFYQVLFLLVGHFNQDQISFGQFDSKNVLTNFEMDTSSMNYPNLVGNKYKVTDVTKDKLWMNVEDRILS